MGLALEISIYITAWVAALLGAYPKKAGLEFAKIPRRAHIAMVVVTIGMALAIAKAVLDARDVSARVAAERVRDNLILDLLERTPPLEYEWQSNFIPVARAQRPIEVATNPGTGDVVASRQLTGVLIVRNLGDTLIDIEVQAWMSTDDQVAHYPFSLNAPGIAFPHITMRSLQRGEVVRVDVIREFSERGFNWLNLISADEDSLTREHEKLVDSMTNAHAVRLTDTYSRPVCAYENLDSDGWKLRAIYGRILVGYTSNGFRYHDTLTLVMGYAFKVGSSTMVMSHIDKQGLTGVSILPTTTNQVLRYRHYDLITEQIVNNHDEDLALPEGAFVLPFQIRDEAGGRFSGTYSVTGTAEQAERYFAVAPKWTNVIKCWDD